MAKNKTGWHMEQVFPPLKQYWPALELSPNARVLVPLCGKTLDIDWLAQQGYFPIGIDVSEIALKQIMDRQDQSFSGIDEGPFKRFTAPSMELWCGNIFNLHKKWLPELDAVYDKAALIALPKSKRKRYSKVIQSMMNTGGRMLLNCFEYPPQEMSGPPFAVFKDELNQLYGDKYHIKMLHSHSVFEDVPKFQQRGLESYLDENIYLLNYING